MANIRVFNGTGRSIRVFISKYSHNGGSDEWWKLVAGDSDTWVRYGWELLAVEFDDGDRRGIYFQASWDRTVNVYGKENIQH